MNWFNTFSRAWTFEVSSKFVNDKYFDMITYSSLFIQLLISHFISFIIFKVLHMRKCTLNNRQSGVDAEKNMWVSNLQIEFVGAECVWFQTFQQFFEWWNVTNCAFKAIYTFGSWYVPQFCSKFERIYYIWCQEYWFIYISLMKLIKPH